MLSELHFYAFKEENEDFFGGLMVKNPPANVSIPDSVRSSQNPDLQFQGRLLPSTKGQWLADDKQRVTGRDLGGVAVHPRVGCLPKPR